MKFFLSFLLLALAAVTQAASATGDRLLSIWEDVEDQKLYSKFVGDLESMQHPIDPPAPHHLELTNSVALQGEATRSLMRLPNRTT